MVRNSSQLVSPQKLLLVFAALYPLMFFPGMLFWKPSVFENLVSQPTEFFLLLPKLTLLLIVGLLGFLSSRPIPWREPFVWLLGGHLVFVALGIWNAKDDLSFGLIGPDRRMDGLLYQVALVLLALFGYIAVRRGGISVLQGICAGLLAGGAIQGVIAVLQRLGVDPVDQFVRYFTAKAPVGSIGQPGMLAGLLLCTFLAGLVLYILDPRKNIKPWIMLGLLIIAAGIGVSTNRSALIALLIGIVGINLSRRSLELLAISALSIFALLGARYSLPNNTHFERDYADTGTFTIRTHIWGIAADVLRNNPSLLLVGGGPDAFKLAMLRNPPIDKLLEAYRLELSWPKNATISKVQVVQEPGSPLRSKQIWVTFSQYGTQKDITTPYDFLLDKAHNFLLDRLLSYGVFSLLIWLLLYLYPVWKGVVSRTANIYGVAWILLALFIYYLAWFPVIQVEPLHILVIAAAWALFAKERVPTRKATQILKTEAA